MRPTLVLVALRMVLRDPRLAARLNRYLMRFTRIHGYLRSVAVANKLMSVAPAIPVTKSAPALAGLVPEDINACPRRVRAMYKALDLGLRDVERSR